MGVPLWMARSCQNSRPALSPEEPLHSGLSLGQKKAHVPRSQGP